MVENKVVLITGCSSGFGYLSSLEFAKSGWNVYGTLRDINTPTAQILLKAGVSVIKMDVTQEKEISAGIAKIIEKEKRIDVLVNNAGVGFIGAVEDFSPEEVKAQFEVNLIGVHRLIREVLPHMRKQGTGKIINISSIAARATTALYGIYSATKMALEGMSEALALEVAPWNILVSLVEPGSFATEFGKNMKFPEELLKKTSYSGLYKKYTTIRNPLDSKNTLLDYFRNPLRVAKLIVKIANSRHPRLRYVIGLSTPFVILGATLIPYKIRYWFLRVFYKW